MHQKLKQVADAIRKPQEEGDFFTDNKDAYTALAILTCTDDGFFEGAVLLLRNLYLFQKQASNRKQMCHYHPSGKLLTGLFLYHFLNKAKTEAECELPGVEVCAAWGF